MAKNMQHTVLKRMEIGVNESLVRRIRAGDSKAFEELARLRKPELDLYSKKGHVSRNMLLIQLWLNIAVKKISSASNATSVSLASQAALRSKPAKIRENKKNAEALPLLARRAVTENTPFQEAAAKDMRETILKTVLTELASRKIQAAKKKTLIFRKYFFEGKTLDEIGSELKVNHQAVHSNINHTLRVLSDSPRFMSLMKSLAEAW